MAEYVYQGRFKGYRKTCPLHHGYWQRGREKNPAWRGGRHVGGDGYVKVRIAGEGESDSLRGASAYALEHRLVMEAVLGRRLHRTEIVHHLNGIRSDNRPENLAVIHGPTGHETWTYARALQARIRELEERLHKCTCP